MTEHALQCQVAEYLDAVLAPSAWYTSIGHGGGGKIRGAKLKKAGVKRGVPDILICWRKGHVPGIGWIELKTKTGRMSDEQHDVAAHLVGLWHYFAVCRSVDEVRGTLDAWGVGTREAKREAAA